MHNTHTKIHLYLLYKPILLFLFLSSWVATKQNLDQVEDQGSGTSHSTPRPHAAADVGSQGDDQQQPNEVVQTEDSRLASIPTPEPAAAATPQQLYADDIRTEVSPSVPSPLHEPAAASVPHESDDESCLRRHENQELGSWKNLPHIMVDHSNPSNVKDVMRDHICKRIRPFNTSLRLIGVKDCFKLAIGDGTNTILLIPNGELHINNETLDAAAKFRANPGRKRTAEDSISKFYLSRKIQVLGPRSTDTGPSI
ncbi:hypothetical protein OIDMADRAFT_57053 [Oidiodendron maius Zn]|uniref:Uncharacterized protein n=1 Tax=Oidiodendron maius (strain Zn) TaxID=913774 RepID=A0A0C3CIB4_OIDMZ|nr:hypothetical protein OIDMADRAFT_57053 [Oidiodendron maius Zn]